MAKSGFTLNGVELRDDQLDGLDFIDRDLTLKETMGALVRSSSFKAMSPREKTAAAMIVGLASRPLPKIS